VYHHVKEEVDLPMITHESYGHEQFILNDSIFGSADNASCIIHEWCPQSIPNSPFTYAIES